MALAPEKEEKVKVYITKALDRGFSLSVIEAKLREVGYKQEDIAQITRSFTAPEKDRTVHANKKFLLILLVIGVAIGALLGAWYIAPQTTCAEYSCFSAAANRCGTATYTSESSGTTLQHRVENCLYTRTVVSISPEEPPEVRELFMDKSLTCTYAEGAFNSQWIETLSLDLEQCTGDLKEAIGSIVRAQEELGII